jgi:hypothetical protein
MRARTALSPVLAAHHIKCQNTNELLSAELHGLYLAYDGPVNKLKSVRTFAEFVLTRHPERPGFRTYNE